MGKNLYFLWLSLLCLAVFVIQLTVAQFTELFLLNQSSLNKYQIYRFLTAIFLHGSITHLLFNLFALMFFGIILERTIGSKKFLIVFFSSGIIANIVAVNYYPSSLGASGAIYGIMGALAVIKPFMMVWAFGLIMPMFLASIFWITADILRDLGAFGPTNTGSIAHLSGILLGIILGLILKINIKKPKKKMN